MADARDDMVWRPRFGKAGAAHAPRVATQRRAARETAARRGIVARFLKRKLLTDVAGRALAGTQLAGIRRVGRFAANPVVLAAAGAVLVFLAAARLASGRSFENMGQMLQKDLFGDLTPEASAKIRTRNQLSGDDGLMAHVAARGTKDAQFGALFDALYQQNLLATKGQQSIMNDPHFQVNGFLDMVLLRLRDKIKESWRQVGGPQEAERLGQLIQASPVAFGRLDR